MMALLFKTKKEAKEALKEKGTLGPENVMETSFFGPEFKDGKHSVVVSLQPEKIRNSYAQITIENGRITKIV